MAVNIPNIGTNLDALLNGVKTGSGMFANLMHPIIEREKQKQLENHFQEQLKLSKAAAGRAAQAAADAHKKMDPMYEINQYKALEDWVKGQAAAQQAGQSGGSQIPSIEQPSMPTQEMGEGMGMFTPEGMQQVQQPPQMVAPTGGGQMGGLNLELLKAHPMLRGFAKKHLGFDPLAEIPQTAAEKQAAQLDLFKQKEALKAQNKTGDIATNNILTANQKSLQALDLTLPVIKSLVEGEVPGIGNFSPAAKQSYESKTGGVIDTLIAAQDLPKISESVALVKQQLRRGTGESVDAYKGRMRELYNHLLERRKSAKQILATKRVSSEGDLEPLEDPNSVKEIGGKKYKKINGEWHEV